MTAKRQKRPADWDSDDVRFYDDAGNPCGSGIVAKGDVKICIVRCPKCGRENHGLIVVSGFCAWCGFQAGDIISSCEPKQMSH